MKLSSALLLSFGLTGIVANGYCGEGLIDTSFGNGGRVLDNFLPEAHGYGAAAACLGPQNKITTLSEVGKAINEDVISFGLARYKENGTPDDGFSFDGRMRFIGKSSASGAVRSISCRSDGSVIVALNEYVNDAIGNVSRLYRITANGALDQTFGANGNLMIDTPYEYTEASAIASLPNGKIAIAGEVSSQNLASRIFVALANSNGVIEASFGNNGYSYFIVDQDSMTDETISDLTFDAQGRLLMAGSIMTAANNRDMAVWRLLPNGDFDMNFSADGMATIDFDVGGEHQDYGTWILPRRNGRILVGGYSSGAGAFISMAQFLPDGQLDVNGFGAGSGRATDFVVWDGSDVTGSLDALLMESGSVIVSGLTGSANSQTAAMVAARFDSNGNRDLSFGDDGFNVEALPSGQYNSAAARSILVQPKRYVMAGYSLTDDMLHPNSTANDIALIGLGRDEIFADSNEGLGPVH